MVCETVILLGYPNKLRRYCQWNPKRCDWRLTIFQIYVAYSSVQKEWCGSVLWGRHSFKICKFHRKAPAVAYFLLLQVYYKRNVVALFSFELFGTVFLYNTSIKLLLWHLFVTDFISTVLFNSILILWFIFFYKWWWRNLLNYCKASVIRP